MWRRRGWLFALAGLMGVVPAVAAAFVRVPYFLLSPGEARGVAQLIKVDDPQVTVYDPKGAILFTTVSLRGNVNVYEALQGWLDDEIEVVPEERITGGQPRDQVKQINIEAMDTSKLTATKVALERLGYRVGLDGKGAVVTDVLKDTPAHGKLQVGDVILAVDGETVGLNDQAVAKVRRHKPGDTINLHFRRGTAEQDLSLVAADSNDGTHTARIGVVLGQTLEATYKFPVSVSIDTGEVGGPSAGLAFTLALIDELSPGELTGGRPVAVTGTIDINGNVGLVGGVAQKTVTARRAGAVAFLVPPDEEAEAKTYAGRMRIVPVKDLSEALAALEDLGGSGLALPSAPPGS
ncbi:MAG: YlbL family protein [Acidimicrobiia bacterium]